MSRRSQSEYWETAEAPNVIAHDGGLIISPMLAEGCSLCLRIDKVVAREFLHRVHLAVDILVPPEDSLAKCPAIAEALRETIAEEVRP